MLIGKFPFEGDSASTAVIADPVKKIWLQQNKRKWSENSLLIDQLKYLSPEVTDLLDRMFDLDEGKRIDIAGIKSHPWFKKPMRPHLEEAIAKMEQEQAENERKVAAGDFRSQMRDAAVQVSVVRELPHGLEVPCKVIAPVRSQNMIRLATSAEFREQSSQPVGRDSRFEILTRIRLRTLQVSCVYLPSSHCLGSL